MQLGARYKAVYELMENIFKDRQPADNIINNYFRERRYIGSGDRRFISEKIWDIIRKRCRLEFETGELNLRKMLLLYLKDENLDEIFTNNQYSLPSVTKTEKDWLENLQEEPYPDYIEAECPKWLFEKINNIELLKSLNNPATADLRINGSYRDEIIKQLTTEGFEVEKTPNSPIGIRAKNRLNLNNCIAYQEGLVEVQDEASQIVSILSDVKPENKVIDYCCGAGGKSLTIAYLLNSKGSIEAHDIDASRLEQLKPRMKRLGIENIKLINTYKVGNEYDRFIVDAPCSGSGTWRRSPDAKFRLTQDKVNALNETQSQILEMAYSKTKVGGRIIYITCSVLKEENEELIEKFKKKHPNIKSLNLRKLWEQKIETKYIGCSDYYLQFSPIASSTDGFFISILEKE